MGFPPVPAEVKPVAHLMKLADEHESRNIVVAYWARMAACRLALKMTPGKRTSETSNLIKELLDWLEVTKSANRENDGIVSETAAQAIIEEYALRMFEYGDKQDRALIFDKNTIKSFYTAGMLMDVLEQFGLSEDLHEKQRYAKWKAAFIHNCLKSGEKPYPGPPNEQHKIVHVSELPDDDQQSADNDKKNEEDNRNGAYGFTPSEDSSNRPTFGQAGNSFDNKVSPVSPDIPQQPGSVTPVAPAPVPVSQPTTYLISSNNGLQVTLSPDQIQKAQKFCKYATSALNYDDVKTAIENLHKALNLLQHGVEE